MDANPQAQAAREAAERIADTMSFFGSSKHRSARVLKFQGAQARKSAVEKSRRRMRKASKRGNRGH